MKGTDLTTTGSDTAEAASAISRGVVGIYARLYGHGPVQAHTDLTDRYALTILGETFTTAERTLVGADRSEQVEQTRRAFQEAARDEFVAVAEAASERKVDVFMSQIDPASETAIELFIFAAPDNENGDHT